MFPFRFLLAALVLTSLSLVTADAPKPKPGAATAPKEAGDKAAVVWKDDEMCQFVFFAVLEGLYRDGVQNEVVDAIISDLSEKEADGVKTHFVFRCELCHATYEAFRSYRQRPAFLGGGGSTTFGEGVDKKILEELKSDDARTRVYAMGRLVRPWIMHRIEETRKTDEEKTAMKKRFKQYASDGTERLGEHIQAKDKFYLDWRFYGSCQACEAATDLGKRGF